MSSLKLTTLSRSVLTSNTAFTQNGRRFFATQHQGPYVLVDKTTKVICQGLTGKRVSNPIEFVWQDHLKKMHFLIEMIFLLCTQQKEISL